MGTEDFNYENINKEIKTNIKETILYTVLIVGVYLLVSGLTTLILGEKYLVSGDSMSPTLHDKDTIYVDENYEDFKNGDIIIFNEEDINGNKQKLVKRIIASEGDILDYNGNSYKVNNKVVEDKFAYYVYYPNQSKNNTNTNKNKRHSLKVSGNTLLEDNLVIKSILEPEANIIMNTFLKLDKGNKIPKDKYFVLGDNRSNSRDSREIGLIDKSDIIGKVKFKD